MWSLIYFVTYMFGSIAIPSRLKESILKLHKYVTRQEHHIYSSYLSEREHFIPGSKQWVHRNKRPAHEFADKMMSRPQVHGGDHDHHIDPSIDFF